MQTSTGEKKQERTLENSPFPVAFPAVSRRGRPTLAYPCAGSETYRCEVMGIGGKFQKEGLVEEISTGRTWRVAADEGKYLRGTDLAPAPLWYWGAGLHADVTLRIAALCRERAIELGRLGVLVRQGFASKGSFVRGEAVALVFGLHWSFDIESNSPVDDIRGVIAVALAGSPTVAAMTVAREGNFALYTNGRSTSVEGVPASKNPAETDPYLKYTRAPEPTGEAVHPEILSRIPGEGADVMELKNDSSEAFCWHLKAKGELDLETGLVRTTVGVPEAKGSSRWIVVSDAEGLRAPSPLAHFAMGTAFCYHTQLCRYIEVRQLPIEAARIVQTSRFSVVQSETTALGHSDAFDTHLFMNGRTNEQETRSLLTMGANTCYAHRALGADIQMTVDILVNGAPVVAEIHASTEKAALAGF